MKRTIKNLKHGETTYYRNKKNNSIVTITRDSNSFVVNGARMPFTGAMQLLTKLKSTHQVTNLQASMLDRRIKYVKEQS